MNITIEIPAEKFLGLLTNEIFKFLIYLNICSKKRPTLDLQMLTIFSLLLRLQNEYTRTNFFTKPQNFAI